MFSSTLITYIMGNAVLTSFPNLFFILVVFICVFTLLLSFFSPGRSQDGATISFNESNMFSRGRTEKDVDRKCGEDDQTFE